ncbi:MAG: hypothetical protein ACSLFM_07820 [Tepidiformaceae bacterium]
MLSKPRTSARGAWAICEAAVGTERQSVSAGLATASADPSVSGAMGSLLADYGET